MTKAVRIENADTSDYKVRVRVQDRVWDPVAQAMTDEWKDVEVQLLAFPTAMTNNLYLTSTRRFIVEEYTGD
jgi:hypothetical protein